MRARAAFNLLTCYGSAARVEEARVLYGELRALSEAHAADPAMREWRAKGLVNLLNNHGNAGRAEARDLYEELHGFATSHTDEPMLAEWLAVATQVMGRFTGSAEDQSPSEG